MKHGTNYELPNSGVIVVCISSVSTSKVCNLVRSSTTIFPLLWRRSPSATVIGSLKHAAVPYIKQVLISIWETQQNEEVDGGEDETIEKISEYQ